MGGTAWEIGEVARRYRDGCYQERQPHTELDKESTKKRRGSLKDYMKTEIKMQ